MGKGSRTAHVHSGRSKKRKYTGNQFTETLAAQYTSKSAEKLKKSKDTSFDVHIDQTSGYSILNFFTVFSSLQNYVKCKDCNSEISFTKYGQRGLGFKLSLKCVCGEKFIDSCRMIGSGYEVNRRLIFVFRLLGIGLAGVNKFCGLMDIGSGFHTNVYYDIVNTISIAVNAIFDLVTLKAVNEERKILNENGVPDDVLTVSGDGSWAKRGFSSLIGIVSLILKHTGKVVDVVIRSSHCRMCQKWKGKENTIEYLAWHEKHKEFCKANHSGSSGKMEVDGVVDMFLRSLERFNVRYGYYIGDGDSSTFKTLLNVHPYGEDVVVKKLECILHVAKRVFKRANDARKALIQKKKTLKEVEEKKVAPKKSNAKKVVAKKSAVIKKPPQVKTQGLTIKLMKELSTNYALAVRRNIDSVENMRKEIWSGFYHKISTDRKPQHFYCSSDWCKYLKAKQTKSQYKHPPALSQEVQEILKPIYEDLTKTELLERCLGGHTQNNNESFNQCVWSMAPKHLCNGKTIVDIVSKTAACVFNEGFEPILKLMELAGMKIGPIAIDYVAKHDDTRVSLAERRSSDSSKEARTQRKKTRFDSMDHFDAEEGPSYGAGMAD